MIDYACCGVIDIHFHLKIPSDFHIKVFTSQIKSISSDTDRMPAKRIVAKCCAMLYDNDKQITVNTNEMYVYVDNFVIIDF